MKKRGVSFDLHKNAQTCARQAQGDMEQRYLYRKYKQDICFKCIAFWVILNAYDVYNIALYECNFACMWFATRGTEQYFT